MVPDIAALPENMPMMSIAIAPRERKDDVRLSSALQRILEEDPSLRLVHVPETGETVLEGHGEMHLRVVVDRIATRYGVPVTTSVPRIAYRETIRKAANVRGRHKKQSGGHGQFGDVVLTIRPQPRGSGNGFEEKITGGVVPRQYISSVEAGVREYLDMAGPLGFPVVDVAVTLTDGSCHTVDSSDMAFRTAAATGLRDALAKAQPAVLEPISLVTIVVPDRHQGDVLGALNARRGRVTGSSSIGGGSHEIVARVPTAEIQRYAIELRSMTGGRGRFTAVHDHYDLLPKHLESKVVKKK
jgi:elongation factor G